MFIILLYKYLITLTASAVIKGSEPSSVVQSSPQTWSFHRQKQSQTALLLEFTPKVCCSAVKIILFQSFDKYIL